MDAFIVYSSTRIQAENLLKKVASSVLLIGASYIENKLEF